MAAPVSNVSNVGYRTPHVNCSPYVFRSYPQPLVPELPLTNYEQSFSEAFAQPRFDINPHITSSLPNFYTQQSLPAGQNTFRHPSDNYAYPSLSLLNGYQSQPIIPASGCFTLNSAKARIKRLCGYYFMLEKNRKGAIARKGGEHPFTWRRRTTVPHAEGMTRTSEKYRVVYTEKQRVGLEKEFKDNKFITTKIRTRISKDLDLSERQIKIWFQNRRAKERRQTKKPANGQDEYDDAFSNVFTSQNKVNNQSQKRSSCRYSKATFPVSKDDDTFDRPGIIQSNTDPCLPDRKFDCQYPLSPSEWNSSPNNVMMPQLNISPFTPNNDACFLSRSWL